MKGTHQCCEQNGFHQVPCGYFDFNSFPRNIAFEFCGIACAHVLDVNVAIEKSCEGESTFSKCPSLFVCKLQLYVFANMSKLKKNI